MEKKIATLGSLFTPNFSVDLDKVEFNNGKTGLRLKVNHPEAAAIIPILEDGRILFVRQWRYALKRETLEIPAGKLDPGENPEECARRELMEETGYSAENFIHLLSFAPVVGYSDEMIHIFLAKNLKKVTELIDEREISSVEAIYRKDLLALIHKGDIIDGKTILGIALIQNIAQEDVMKY